MSNTVKLIKPCLELQAEFMDMVQDFVKVGESDKEFECRRALENFAAYVQDCLDWDKGKALPADWVPMSTFWLIRNDNVILGVSSLRHKLNKNLRVFGGNIGYKIRPGQRQKGYGSLILKLTIAKAKLLGLKRVLITCDDDNVASAKIIEKNGGVLKDKCDRAGPGKLTRRYWIDLTKP
jgi:predicted acetyltransferase